MRVLSAGDTAIILEFGREIEISMSRKVFKINSILRQNPPEGLIATMPTFRSITLHFDPLVTDGPTIGDQVELLLSKDRPIEAAPTKRWRLPVCYHPDMGPDLNSAAAQVGLEISAYARMHSSIDYVVYMIGGFPGYPHMGDVPEALRVPRLKTPRLKVPAGSVAVAGKLTAIYPKETPGGWNLIGRTPVSLFDPARDPAALLAPGDTVSFQSVNLEEFDQIALKVASGESDASQFAVGHP